jgi:16S rRNA (cytosine967-C5)-methyltransferase
MKSKIVSACVISDLLLQKGSLSSKFPLPQETDKKALIQEICFGVCRWFFKLDFIAKQLLQKPMKAMDSDIYALILIGLYQIIYMETPENIIVSESVDAAKKLKKQWATGLINATLRNFLRQKDELLEKADKNLLAKYSHPQWLTDKIKTAYPADWESILNANNQRPPMSLRVNRLKISRDDYLKKLMLAGMSATPCATTPFGLILEKPVDVKHLPGFLEGEIFIQDCGAQLAAELLDLKPNQTVLDACAAPGGKTTHIFEMEPHIKKLVAIDIDEKRIGKVKENWDRLFGFNIFPNADILLLKAASAADIKSWRDNEPFDRILLDAPCSASGIIRRHPDIKLMRRKDDIKTLAEQQLSLLIALWPTLKIGGKLLYVTCSILPDENEHVVEKFLEKTPDAQKIKEHQLLPTQNGTDGFYFALLNKGNPPSLY